MLAHAEKCNPWNFAHTPIVSLLARIVEPFNIEFSCAAVSASLARFQEMRPAIQPAFQGDNCNDLLSGPGTICNWRVYAKLRYVSLAFSIFVSEMVFDPLASQKLLKVGIIE